MLVSTVVYFGGGFIYLHFVKGNRGIEQIPNLEFWRALPGLVYDGCVYFIYLVRRALAACGLGAAPDAPVTYSTMPEGSGSSSAYAGSQSASSPPSYDSGSSSSSSTPSGGFGTI